MTALLLATLLLAPTPQAGPVRAVQKVSDRFGGFLPALRNRDQFGRSATLLGDLDLDGVADVAVAAHGDDDGGLDRGAVYVLRMQPDGNVKASTKISALAGGFAGPLDDGDQMGRGIAGLGDLDGDGIPDLAIGANNDDDGGPNCGAVWILFLNPDGSVRAQAKISSTQGGLAPLRSRDEFGRAVACPGDLDADGIPDLVVGAPYDDAGGTNKGAVHVLTLRRDGSVKTQSEISLTSGGFRGPLRPGDLFGFSLACPGDLDGDGIGDLMVGAVGDDDGGLNAGAVWILYLRADASVKAQVKLGGTTPGLGASLHPGDQFGVSVAGIGDLDADGRPELCVGAVKDDDGGLDRGAAWILGLTAEGGVVRAVKLSSSAGPFPSPLRNSDWFGSALSPLGDLDGDGTPDLLIAARMDDDMGRDRGAVYFTFLAPQVAARAAAAPQTSGDPELRIERSERGLELVFELPDAAPRLARVVLGDAQAATPWVPVRGPAVRLAFPVPARGALAGVRLQLQCLARDGSVLARSASL